MKQSSILRALPLLRWGAGVSIATVGLAGIPEDVATWASWLDSVRPYLSHDLVRTVMVAGGVGLVVYPRLAHLAKRALLHMHGGSLTGDPLSAQPTGGSTSARTSEFSDGDWITAAIVAPDRAVALFQKVAVSVRHRSNASRETRIEQVAEAVGREVIALRERYKAGGDTDEARSEACIAKMTVDAIEREMTSWRWTLEQQPALDPVTELRNTIRRLETEHAG